MFGLGPIFFIWDMYNYYTMANVVYKGYYYGSSIIHYTKKAKNYMFNSSNESQKDTEICLKSYETIEGWELIDIE